MTPVRLFILFSIYQFATGLNIGKSQIETTCTSKEFEDTFPCDTLKKYPIKMKEYLVAGGTCISVLPPDPNVVNTMALNRLMCFYFYGGHLAQLDRTLDEMLTANLTNSENGYYIGLGRAPFSKEFFWSAQRDKPTWFNWAPGEPKIDRGTKQCVYKDSEDGFWRTSYCNENRSSICQTASARNFGQPQMAVPFYYGATIFYVGKSYKIKCAAHVGPSEKRLYFSATGKLEEFLDEAKRQNQLQLSKEDRNYVVWQTRCVLQANTSLTLNVTVNMTQSTLSCCRDRNDGFKTCSPPLTLAPIHFLPQRPQVESNIKDGEVYLGETMDVKCSAFVGTDGQLRWALRTSLGTRWWKIETSGQLLIYHNSEWVNYTGGDPQLPAELIVKEPVVVSPTQGPRIESYFHFEVSQVLQGGMISCRSYYPHSPHLNTHDLVETSYELKVLKKSAEDEEDVWTQMIVLIALTIIFSMMTLGACLKVYLPPKYTKRLTTASLMSVVSRRSLATERPTTTSQAYLNHQSFFEQSLTTTQSRTPKVGFKPTNEKPVSKKDKKRKKQRDFYEA